MKALVVGDRFIRSSAFSDALQREAAQRSIDVEIDELQLNYPSADALPLPESAGSTEFRPMWERPSDVLARAESDAAADPTIREYTGPVDLLAPHVSDVDLLLVHLAPVSRAALSSARRLRAIGCARGGPVNVNIDALNARRIPLFNCPGRNSQAVAEFLAGAIISLTRNITSSALAMAKGEFRLDLYAHEHTGHELRGRTCGLIGVGAVGRAFAPIAHGFGLHLVAHDPYVGDNDLAALQIGRVSLDQLLQNAHVVIVAARLTPETRGMIGEREFGLLQEDSVFVNTARAEIVDQQAFRTAVERGQRAIVDVYSPEPPLRDDPILRSPNVLLTPHIAGASREAALRGAEVSARCALAYLADGSLENCVNAAALSATPAGR